MKFSTGGKKENPGFRILLTLTVLITGVYLFCLLNGVTALKYDAAGYWRLGKSFWSDGKFSFLNYPENIRGYTWPLVVGLCRRLGMLCGNKFAFLWLLNSVLAVMDLSVFFPALFDLRLGTKRWIAGSAAGTGLFLLFWSDLIRYPLSDLFTFSLYLSGLLAIKKSIPCIMAEKKRIRVWKIGLMYLGIGAILYTVYNARTVYLLPIAAALVFGCAALIVMHRKISLKRTALLAVSMLLGMYIVSVPQQIINENYYENPSPLVITGKSADGLFVRQLEWGLSMSRYETYIGDKAYYPKGGVRFINEAGDEIAQNNDVTSIKDYIKLLFRQPLDLMGIYFEHLISGMTLFYRKVYTEDIRISRKTFLLNMAVFVAAYLCILSLWEKRKQKGAQLAVNGACLGLILFPALIAVPGALETRFFLPVYVSVYVLLTMFADYRAVCEYLKKHWMSAGISVLFLILCWLMTASNIMSGIEFGSLTFHMFRLT